MFVGSLIDEFIARVQKYDRQDFCRTHKNFFLLGTISKDSPRGELDFYTGIIHTEQNPANTVSSFNARKASAKPGQFLVKIEKKSDNAWPNWFSVGRSKNNDVVIRHPSVSKLHARLDTQGPIESQSQTTSGLWITDVGSSEGTIVNDTPIAKLDRYPLQIGDEIVFGSVVTLLMDAGALYDILKKR